MRKQRKKEKKKIGFVLFTRKKNSRRNPVMNLFQPYNATSKRKNAKLILSIGSKLTHVETGFTHAHMLA